MLGAGWSVTGVPAAPHAIALLAKVPWDRTNQKLTLSLELVDADGRPVMLNDPNGNPVPVGQQAELEVGRPAGIAPGSMRPAAARDRQPACESGNRAASRAAARSFTDAA